LPLLVGGVICLLARWSFLLVDSTGGNTPSPAIVRIDRLIFVLDVVNGGAWTFFVRILI
jgi:hypothetical protein